MKILYLAALLLLLSVSAVRAEPFLGWDAVTTGTDGLLLQDGLEVSEYRVYQCTTSLGNCTKATATLTGTVPAPTVQFDLAGTLVPAVYIVTAVNRMGESADSIPFKVKKPDLTKNQKVQ